MFLYYMLGGRWKQADERFSYRGVGGFGAVTQLMLKVSICEKRLISRCVLSLSISVSHSFTLSTLVHPRLPTGYLHHPFFLDNVFLSKKFSLTLRETNSTGRRRTPLAVGLRMVLDYQC